MFHLFSKALLVFGLILPCMLKAQPATPEAGQGLAVQWEVKHRFPLFRSGSALQDVLKLAPGQSLHDWSRDVLAKDNNLLKDFTRAYDHKKGKGCAVNMPPENFPTLWDPCKERYAPELFIKGAYDVLVQMPTSPAGLCRFKAGDSEKVAACANKVTLRIPSPDVSYTLTVETESGALLARDIIRIQDVLLIAFGDSFSSGESNPDVPALHQNTPTRQSDGQMLPGVHWLDAPHGLQRPAAWLDSRCHRSLLSWPVLAAARLAANNPHRVVRVASWACSGAEITDGFYSPQLRSGALQHSQFEAARHAVCRAPKGSGPSFEPVVRLEKGEGLKTGTRGSSIKGCAPEDLKIRVDAALFTFGGNDVFFAPVLADAVMMTGSRFLPMLNLIYKPLRKGKVRTPEDAAARINGKASTYDNLPVRFASLAKGLAALGIPSERVFQVQYPNPLHDSNDRICGISPHDGMDVVEKLQRVANLSEGESLRAEFNVIDPLTRLIGVNTPGWTIVDGHLKGMRKNGLCAFDVDRRAEFAIPRLAAGMWVNNFEPSGYKHYANTARWFRTPDDVAMGMYEGSSLLPIQGAFHPSAKAHAFIGDEVYDQLSRALLKP